LAFIPFALAVIAFIVVSKAHKVNPIMAVLSY
jgi:hypothetical protein